MGVLRREGEEWGKWNWVSDFYVGGFGEGMISEKRVGVTRTFWNSDIMFKDGVDGFIFTNGTEHLKYRRTTLAKPEVSIDKNFLK